MSHNLDSTDAHEQRDRKRKRIKSDDDHGGGDNGSSLRSPPLNDDHKGQESANGHEDGSDSADTVEKWIPLKQRKQMLRDKIESSRKKRRGGLVEADQGDMEVPIAGPRATKSLLDQKAELLKEGVPEPPKNKIEEIAEEERQLLEADDKDPKLLIPVKQRAKGEVFTESLSTSWRAPHFIR